MSILFLQCWSPNSKRLHQLNICSEIVGQPSEKVHEPAYDNIMMLAHEIISDPDHVLTENMMII